MNGLQERITLEKRLFIVSETIRYIDKYFIHWDDALIRQDEMDRVTAEYFEKARTAADRYEFTLVMWELMGLLRNSHTWYHDQAVDTPKYGLTGFSIAPIADEWVLWSYTEDLHTNGDAIVSINGKSMDEWYRECGKYIGAAKEESRRVKLGQVLPFFLENDEVEMDCLDRDGRLKSYAFRLLMPEDVRCQEAMRRQNAQETVGKWIEEGRIAYIQIPSFNEPRFEEKAIELVNGFREATALIVDVRGNGGGSTPSRLTELLMDRPYRWWMERSRHPEWMRRRHSGGELGFPVDYRYVEWRPSATKPSDLGSSYKGRVIILIDPYTGSAAEDFVMPFKDNGRATLVGERTWGSTGQPAFPKLGGGTVHAGIGSIRAYMPNGDLFEGVGISPDVAVRLTREDIYAGRDTVLEAAISLC